MATQARGPSFSYYVRRPYQQVDQPPNLPLGPFPKVPPFIAREEGNDTQFRKKWAQDFYWAGTTTQGIPAQPVQQVQPVQPVTEQADCATTAEKPYEPLISSVQPSDESALVAWTWDGPSLSPQ